jgi:hypothetical protein
MSSKSDSIVETAQTEEESEQTLDASLRRTRSVNAAAPGRESDVPAGTSDELATGDNPEDSVAALVKDAFRLESATPEVATSPALAPYPFKDDALLDPGFVVSQLSTYPDLTGHYEDTVRILPEDDGTSRALAVLDRIPVVDFHKIGVVYVGPGQASEGEILRNRAGSAAYHQFLAGLGAFNRLKGLRDVYTGGLDISEDLDGACALSFEDEGSQIAFHVTTLMPNSDADPACTSKKRHIGNDYVLIVFNESGRDYEFRTVASQFNFVNFVVVPLQGAGGRMAGRGGDETPTLYSVTMQRREDMPDFCPLAETKIVPASALSVLVRQLATHADTFAQIFYLNSGGTKADWISNWRERLRQIKRAKDRASKPQPAALTGSAGSTGDKAEAEGLSLSPVAMAIRVPGLCRRWLCGSCAAAPVLALHAGGLFVGVWCWWEHVAGVKCALGGHQ